MIQTQHDFQADPRLWFGGHKHLYVTMHAPGLSPTVAEGPKENA